MGPVRQSRYIREDIDCFFSQDSEIKVHMLATKDWQVGVCSVFGTR
jgi:hypothetical protein